jgi:ribulose-5-phosphate 4-epimerase/fuculose-1-phosphate aldolase
VPDQGAARRSTPDHAGFASAGRVLFSLGLVKEAEGTLSTFDGEVLVITRTGAGLADLSPSDALVGALDEDLPGASSDLEFHRSTYRSRGPGAIAHAHPPGTVPESAGGPGEHGVYAFAATLAEAVEAVVAKARAIGNQEAVR